ncbi:hypothetical protein BDR07DRAFT_1373949 [Suillus spraguei]|nr:hypothetical protein BDR07DRAFT_1373949 [Suillus spraguei]
MTGFHWTILGTGPDPWYNGDINAMSYHTETNEYGQNWKHTTPDFDDKYIKPYIAFILSLFLEHVRKTRAIDYVPITPSSTLGTHTNLVAGESHSSNAGQNLPSHLLMHLSLQLKNMHQPLADTWHLAQHPDGLISFNNEYDFGASGDFGMPDFENPSATGIMNTSESSSNPPTRLDSLSLSPISAWKINMLYTSPPRFPLTSPSDIIKSSPAPFIPLPMFTFPPLPVPPPVPGPSTSAPVSSATLFGNLSSHTVAGNNTVDASANGSRIDTSVGVGMLGAVAVPEAMQVNSGRNITTSSEPIVNSIGQNPKCPRPTESQNERPKERK